VKIPRVGVLSLQGDYGCHRRTLEALGVEGVRVTSPADLVDLDAMILPGGESTTMTRLLETTGLREPLERFVRERPVMGTCAGVILMSMRSSVLPVRPFRVLDIDVERNAYGRQIDSFSAPVEIPAFADSMHGVFIRAPRIRRVGESVEVIARLANSDRQGEPVGVRAGNAVGLCFHPELTTDTRMHAWFLTEVAGLALDNPAVALSVSFAPQRNPKGAS
jgi:5'-phosphate synthase pdxT subunit